MSIQAATVCLQVYQITRELLLRSYNRGCLLILSRCRDHCDESHPEMLNGVASNLSGFHAIGASSLVQRRERPSEDSAGEKRPIGARVAVTEKSRSERNIDPNLKGNILWKVYEHWQAEARHTKENNPSQGAANAKEGFANRAIGRYSASEMPPVSRVFSGGPEYPTTSLLSAESESEVEKEEELEEELLFLEEEEKEEEEE